MNDQTEKNAAPPTGAASELSAGLGITGYTLTVTKEQAETPL